MSAGLRLAAFAIGYESWRVEDINIDVRSGEVVALLGPSGCGKSTLLQTILGERPALHGSVFVADRDVTELPIEKRGIGIVFQQPLLFPHLSVGRNISYGLERGGMPRSQARHRVAELLTWVGLADYENRSVDSLSGGQSQRVALARAMAVAPKVLLLDEPFSALDEDLRRRLAVETLTSLRNADVAVIYVTHSREEAELVADRIVEFESIGRARD